MDNCYVNDFTTTVKSYYKDISKCKALTREQERELMKRAKKNNDTNARNKILSSNLKFVFGEAKKYKGHGVPLEDLISEGNLGLIHAFDKFDTTKNVKFISYAVWWIDEYMHDFIKRRNKTDDYETTDDFMSISVVEKNLVYDKEDEVVKIGDTVMSNMDDMVQSEKQKEAKEIAYNILDKLQDREREIIEYYFGLNGKKELNLKEIGEKLNLSTERVRQLKSKSLLKLKSEMLLLQH